MGKKTNWTISEDQALCRAWLCASDTSIGHGGDHKAGTFWGVVHQLFHAELDTAVDRPVTGLKIRWTRINRDVQRFALTYARVQATVAASRANGTAGAEGERESPEAEAEREHLCIEAAIDLFIKEQGGKFTFESCWKLLRYSPRWMQLLANSAGASTNSFQASSAQLSADRAVRLSSGADAMGSAAGSSLHKRRLAEMMESHGHRSSECSSEVMVAIAEELKRQSDLMEERNAIALFQMELDLVEDDDARAYFTNLRHTYVKRMRREEVEEPEQQQAAQHETAADAQEAKSDADDVNVGLRDGKETADL